MADNVFIKDPNATLDFAFDWSQWLDTGETITSCSVVVQSGLTKVSDDFTSGSVFVWLSSGSVGSRYTISCLVTTSASRVDERTIKIDVKER